VSFKEGAREQALKFMRAAADREDGSIKHVAMENRLYPMRELYGELLLEMGEPAAALHEFETSLEQTPNRYRAILGIARAAAASGNRQRAAEYYGKLRDLAKMPIPNDLKLRKRDHSWRIANKAGGIQAWPCL
jgi:tetratricopeptide (TPR) repeat protein